MVAAISISNEGSDSNAFPMTMRSAPAFKFSRTFSADLIPPPTMIGIDTAPLTDAIISEGTGLEAPLPASMKISLRPNISAAIAVQTAISDLVDGIGDVLLIYKTVVPTP